jgi:hypothetical protein
MTTMRALPILPLFVFVVVGVAVGCSSNDKSGGSTNPPVDTGVDAPVPLGDPQCLGLSFGLSRPVTGVSGGVQSSFTLSSHSVLQSPDPAGKSSMVAQWIGGGIELDWLGTVDTGDVSVIGGSLVYPADDPAPKGAYCVLPGTVLHKTATGGKIDFVVTEGTSCSTGPSDAGVDDASPSDASSPSTVTMKGCIVFNAI